jgi:hypothetical protein
MNFICATPPGGAISFGMWSETCGVEVLLLGPGPPAARSTPDKQNIPVISFIDRFTKVARFIEESCSASVNSL